ncbi:MAG: ThuA domain-containing protein [Clostridia bacterium]|nr:ThuA domain-containing protein [Clostridia bacterium]
MINVTIWNEDSIQTTHEDVLNVYPKGLNGALADFLGTNENMNVRTANLEEPECGLTDEILESTDVLLWWGHGKHHLVPDELVKKIHNRVLRGMGMVFLHSAHFSKPFQSLMGTTCSLKWRDGDRERLWTILPNHPIAKGLPEYFELEEEEMYGERFDIPQPDELVFLGWFSGGEVFRSGCVWYRGLGKVFYFQPGHETNPTYLDANIQKVITNAVNWLAPDEVVKEIDCPFAEPVEASWNERHPNHKI